MPILRRTPYTSRPSSLSRLAASIARSRQRSLDRIRASRAALRRNRLAFAALLLAGVTVLASAAWPFTKAHLEAMTVLKIISGQPVPAFLARVVAEPIVTQDLTIPTNEGPIRARTYTPTRHPNAPALVVFHGVHYLGIDHPVLISFATAMASCGLRVVTPELPNIKDYHVDSTSIRAIGDTTRWFAARTGGPVGVIGLSFSGGLSLVAASDPAFHDAFKFIFAVGSQGSMARVFGFYSTNTDPRPDGTTEHLTAHEYGPLVLEYDYLEGLVPSADLAAIRAVLRAHLYEDKAAEVAALKHLTPEQTVEALHLMDVTSPETLAALARARAQHADEMESLSPGPRLSSLTTPVYLLHGEADNIIPSAETLWMASELEHQHLQAALVSPVLSHIEFGETKPSALDTWRLIHFFALVMHAAGQR